MSAKAKGDLPPPGSDAYATAQAERGLLRKEGEYWAIGYGPILFRLKNTKGVGYLEHLLRHPGVEFHSLDLVRAGIGPAEPHDDHQQRDTSAAANLAQAGLQVGGLGDAGEMLDDQAKAAYRRRLAELREELEEAREFSHDEQAARVEEEIAALTRELSRAIGLRGRSRRAAAASERARQSVTRAIKSAIERIAGNSPALGGLLSSTIRTRTFCLYSPHPEHTIVWEFAAEIPHAEATSSDRSPAAVEVRPALETLAPFRRGFSASARRIAFVRRESEAAELRAMVDGARQRAGGLAMVGGGAGAGKTRLAMEIGDYAAAKGFQCYVGRCYEREQPFPYLPFAEILEAVLASAPGGEEFRRELGENAAELAQISPRLRNVFPDLPPAAELPPQQTRRYIFQSVVEFLSRMARRAGVPRARRSPLGRRSYLRLVELPRQPMRTDGARDRRYLSRYGAGIEPGAGENPGRINPQWAPPHQASRSCLRGRGADASRTWRAGTAPATGQADFRRNPGQSLFHRGALPAPG
jgi:hypothetical protein